MGRCGDRLWGPQPALHPSAIRPQRTGGVVETCRGQTPRGHSALRPRGVSGLTAPCHRRLAEADRIPARTCKAARWASDSSPARSRCAPATPSSHRAPPSGSRRRRADDAAALADPQPAGGGGVAAGPAWAGTAPLGCGLRTSGAGRPYAHHRRPAAGSCVQRGSRHCANGCGSRAPARIAWMSARPGIGVRAFGMCGMARAARLAAAARAIPHRAPQHDALIRRADTGRQPAVGAETLAPRALRPVPLGPPVAGYLAGIAPQHLEAAGGEPLVQRAPGDASRFQGDGGAIPGPAPGSQRLAVGRVGPAAADGRGGIAGRDSHPGRCGPHRDASGVEVHGVAVGWPDVRRRGVLTPAAWRRNHPNTYEAPGCQGTKISSERFLAFFRLCDSSIVGKRLRVLT